MTQAERGTVALRRWSKRIFAPLLNERAYSALQAVAMAIDIRSGRFSEPELELVARFVSPGDTVLDIGANYGMWVRALSRAVGPTGRVLAFEPVPFTVSTLRRVVRLLRLANVQIVDKGAAESSARVQIAVPIQHGGAPSSGLAHLSTRDDERPGREDHVRWPQTREVECELVTIDDVVAPDAPVSLIKLDTEGAELSALRGARRLIDAHKPVIVCEINPWFLNGFGMRVEDITEFFEPRGYTMFRYVAGHLSQVASSEVEDANYVFVPEERLSLVGAPAHPNGSGANASGEDG